MIDIFFTPILVVLVFANFFALILNLCAMISEIWNTWFTRRAEKQRTWVRTVMRGYGNLPTKDVLKNLKMLQDVSFDDHVKHLKTFKNPWVLYKDVKIRTDTKL